MRLRPIGSGTSWRLLSFAFLGEFLPGPDAPSVKFGHRTLSVPAGDVDRLTDQWITMLRSGGSFTELQRA